ncbi:MAG: leucyl aminopeptidase family protein [Rhizobiaceae bacterium]
MHFFTDPTEHFSSQGKSATPIHCVRKDNVRGLAKAHGERVARWAKVNGFEAREGSILIVPDINGRAEMVLFGCDDDSRLTHAGLARKLPEGRYSFAGDRDATLDPLFWAMGGYDFTRYRKPKAKAPTLACRPNAESVRIAEGVYMARDLINTPAGDMGPDALEAAVRQLAKHHKAKVTVIKGDKLVDGNFPMVHAVGRASAQAPRVIDVNWGKTKNPKITLIGKGVTFDTGGLNIKPGSSMALMKKDMGGAANVLGLSHMVMDAKLPVRLRVIIGAVENSISGNAFRPGDVLSTRKGISVEIGNTDAEGRLVLGDCLALGDEEEPQLMIDMATLTGAARVALGPDLPPFYTNDDAFADELSSTAESSLDPLWRMPLWKPYHKLMASKIADLSHINTAGTGFAGSITAALFLSHFVEKAESWAHFDIFGWTPIEKPWATVGGEAQGIRALYALLARRYPV